MSKKIYLALLIMSLCISLPGCGKPGEPENGGSIGSNNNLSSRKDNSNSSSTTETSVTDVLPEETVSSEITGTPEPTQARTQKPKTETVVISQNQQYSGDSRIVKVIGLKEYTKLESDNYTDKAGKGKKFLVLFLSITNNTSKEDYINYNYVSAKVDGKDIENTFLINEPKSYPAIFTHIPAGGTIGGFIVWKVPEDWKKLDFTYNGWKGSDNISLKAKFTPDDLSEPLIYNSNNL